jgi:hypothetical protein
MTPSQVLSAVGFGVLRNIALRFRETARLRPKQGAFSCAMFQKHAREDSQGLGARNG